jgi:hypothetical protein
MENRGKGTLPKNPGEILIKLFKRKVGNFPKTASFLYIDCHFKFCHDITLIIKCDWEIM